MSGGQRQRVSIARALLKEAPIVCLDEPTAALDGKTGRVVMTLLRELIKTQGKTAVIVTHDPRTFDFADRISQVENGRVYDCPHPAPVHAS